MAGSCPASHASCAATHSTLDEAEQPDIPSFSFPFLCHSHFPIMAPIVPPPSPVALPFSSLLLPPFPLPLHLSPTFTLSAPLLLLLLFLPTFHCLDQLLQACLFTTICLALVLPPLLYLPSSASPLSLSLRSNASRAQPIFPSLCCPPHLTPHLGSTPFVVPLSAFFHHRHFILLPSLFCR